MEKFKIKGFIPDEALIANNKTGRKKAQTLAGTTPTVNFWLVRGVFYKQTLDCATFSQMVFFSRNYGKKKFFFLYSDKTA